MKTTIQSAASETKILSPMSAVKTYRFDNGEIQRVQVVTADSFDDLNFFKPTASPEAFTKVVNLYRNFIVPKCPWVFGQMVMVYLPKDLTKELAAHIRIENQTAPGRPAGSITASLGDDTLLCDYLRKYITVRNSKLLFKTTLAREICRELKKHGFLEVACGKLLSTKILPVGDSLGFMSESLPDAAVKVNSNFFVMDCFDVASPADRIGAPIGLMVKNGEVQNPPQFGREALLAYDDGRVEVRKVDLKELRVVFKPEAQAQEDTTPANTSQPTSANTSQPTPALELPLTSTCERPLTCKIPATKPGRYAVIVGCRVESIYGNENRRELGRNESEHGNSLGQRGSIEVPSSGFVLRLPDNADVHAGDSVAYKGFEHVKFGVQVGNSMIVDGVKTEGFISDFYNIGKHLGMRAYPPSLYPLDYEGARAPRIGIGATREGKPCIIWAEGPKKTGYVQGEQSRGATLEDMAAIAEDLGIYNGVNLDGGGSAQILVNNKRELIISDRNPEDDTDAERAVPAGIYIG